MASCRCSDITECKEKLSNLSDAMGFINGAKTYAGNMEDKLTDMSGTYSATFDRDDVESLCTATTGFNDGLINMIGTTAGKIEQKAEELSLSLSKMQNEDNQYHREEEERQRRERENNQQTS